MEVSCQLHAAAASPPGKVSVVLDGLIWEIVLNKEDSK
jgi:hypothetical protein